METTHPVGAKLRFTVSGGTVRLNQLDERDAHPPARAGWALHLYEKDWLNLDDKLGEWTLTFDDAEADFGPATFYDTDFAEPPGEEPAFVFRLFKEDDSGTPLYSTKPSAVPSRGKADLSVYVGKGQGEVAKGTLTATFGRERLAPAGNGAGKVEMAELQGSLSDGVTVRLDRDVYESFAAGQQKVALGRTAAAPTADQPLWVAIRDQANALSFSNYETFVDRLLCADDTLRPGPRSGEELIARRRSSPGLGNVYMSNVDAHALLKIATDAFLLLNCGVARPRDGSDGRRLRSYDEREEAGRLGDSVPLLTIERQLAGLLGENKLPYIRRILKTSLNDVDLVHSPYCYGVLESRAEPCMLELIWSYWHEEGMLVQTLNAISMRFQNRRGPGRRDALANLAIDPLRTLNNLLWGHIQDEQHRLSVVRRTYEYDHQYGLKLVGKAVPPLRSAESRTKFLEAFHNLVYRAHRFYQEDDDTTVIANGFAVLSSLKEVHMLLAEGAHNQVFDLTWTARAEMMVQQWLLSRPEIGSYLGTRPMIPYREGWMAQVDAMKRLQGWTDTSVTHFRDLGVFGEQVLLSVRYGDWINVDSQASAINWARYWRQEIQAYMHAYQAVTGVDLMAEAVSVKQAERRSLLPAHHIQRRMRRQKKRPAPARSSEVPLPTNGRR